MKLIIMVFFSFVFSCFTFANYIETEEVHFVDPVDIPPVEEMVGIIHEDSEEQAIRGEYDNDDRGEEIQLAHGGHGGHGRCKRRHGQVGCGSNGPNIIINPPHIVIPPPVIVSPPVPLVGNVCRNGGFYCYTNYPGPVGTYCTCYSYGIPWLQGQVSTW